LGGGGAPCGVDNRLKGVNNIKSFNKIRCRNYSTSSNIEEDSILLIEDSNKVNLNKDNIFIKNLKYEDYYEDMLNDKSKISNYYLGIKGVYLLFNKSTYKFYIGSSNNLSMRLRNYYFLSKLLDGRYISNSINKYGHNNFSVFILETSKEDISILDREQYYIDLYKPEYNLLKIAGNSLGYKHTEASKLKITLSKKGKKMSIETRELLSNLFKGENNPFYGKKHTELMKKKLSESRKGKDNPMYGKPKSPEFIYYMTRDRNGANNSMYGKPKSAETLLKLRKCIYVYD
jgi:group I intron endonuclease